MPAQWTGKLIGDIHNAGFRISDVAQRAGYHVKYVSTILNEEKEMPKTEQKLRDALEQLINEK